MVVRKYEPKDREQCIAIMRSNTPEFFDPTELEGFETWLTGQDEGRLAYKNTVSEVFYVLVDNGMVVACGGYYITGEGRANMVWGMVDAALHNQRFGKELLKHRTREVSALYPGMPLTLDTTQHTFAFFEKFGFETTQVRTDFYGEGLHRYDMVYKAPGHE